MAFFQTCLEVLKVDIMSGFHEFHAKGLFGEKKKTPMPPLLLLFQRNMEPLILETLNLLA
jgi:hypothetical protein